MVVKTDLCEKLRGKCFVGAEKEYLFAVSDADCGEVSLCKSVSVR